VVAIAVALRHSWRRGRSRADRQGPPGLSPIREAPLFSTALDPITQRPAHAAPEACAGSKPARR
jgi:hypothetical protein